MAWAVDETGSREEVLAALDDFIEHEDTPTFRSPRYRERMIASMMRMPGERFRIVGSCEDGRQHSLSIQPVRDEEEGA